MPSATRSEFNKRTKDNTSRSALGEEVIGRHGTGKYRSSSSHYSLASFERRARETVSQPDRAHHEWLRFARFNLPHNSRFALRRSQRDPKERWLRSRHPLARRIAIKLALRDALVLSANSVRPKQR
jgi:hypothetical protein